MITMNRLSPAKQKAVVACLVEGNSIRATVRMTGVAKNTVAKLLIDLGAACSAYQDEKLRNLPSKRLQCDEIWSFYAKQRNVTEEILEKNPDAGDVWTWTCLDPDSKLMVSWHVGGRSTDDTHQFIHDVASRVSDRVQISTDGLGQYIPAIVSAFGENVDLGQVLKKFAAGGYNPGRYSPPACVGCENKPIIGNPDPKHISTSYIERSNLTLRMSMRRFTRLTNAFSRKVENHTAMVSLFFMYYNFARVHQTLRVTPAMAAGVSDHVWDIEEIVNLL
jgi:IS1 family transposase